VKQVNGSITAYCRISVEEETGKENTSIENQKSIIAEYTANYFPYSVVDCFEDRDRSVYSFEQREGYQEMHKGLMSGKFSIHIHV